jgi:glycosyltransferase involved in cell wall biosynthesis
MKLSVILPVFNEEANIRAAIEETEKVLKNISLEHEIIAVDDGSTDGTWHELKTAALKVDTLRLIRCGKNGGKGQALKLGFEKSSGELVAFLDAGMEINPNHLVGFLKLMEEKGVDVVIGSKHHSKSKVEYPTRRVFWSAVHNTAVKLLLRLPVNDTQVGCKLFKRAALEKVIPSLLVKRYAFDVELFANIHRRGYKILEAPISLNFNSGLEKMRFKDIFKISIDILAIFYRMKILRYYDRAPRAQSTAHILRK